MAMQYRHAIDDITADKSLKLQQYELDEDDWAIVGDLLGVLEVFIWFSAKMSHFFLTMFIDLQKQPHLDKMLSAWNTEPLSPSVKCALKFAHATINKYYSKTDMSNVYRIAMGEY